MAKKIGSSIKMSRRMGQDLGHKQNQHKVARRLTVPPGQHGQRRRRGRRTSEFGTQLLEKQKVKFIYGVLERQFQRYMEKAQQNPQATGEELLRLLETRLDNVIFRLGFAPTRPMARQLISHRHILVNGKRVDIPSYHVRVNDLITLDNVATEIPDVQKLLVKKDLDIPGWMQKKATTGKISRLPERTDIDASVNEQLIVEFYSR